METNMKPSNCIIIHGCPLSKESSLDPVKRSFERNWILWVAKQLNDKGIKTETPKMPIPWNPVYEDWKTELERHPIDKETVLIATSCACSFIVKWLGETKKEVHKLILVAPYSVGEKSNEYMKKFYDIKIDPTIKDRVNEIIMFTSNNEKERGKIGLKIFHEGLGGEIISLKDHGHYTYAWMKTNEFPELIETVSE